jgi:hypothetical protein
MKKDAARKIWSNDLAAPGPKTGQPPAWLIELAEAHPRKAGHQDAKDQRSEISNRSERLTSELCIRFF